MPALHRSKAAQKRELRNLLVTMPDGSVWEIPALVVAYHRAESLSFEFNGDFNASLERDTLPALYADPAEIVRWATNEMDWDDVALFARKVGRKPINLAKGWVESKKELT